MELLDPLTQKPGRRSRDQRWAPYGSHLEVFNLLDPDSWRAKEHRDQPPRGSLEAKQRAIQKGKEKRQDFQNEGALVCSDEWNESVQEDLSQVQSHDHKGQD